MFHTRFRFLSPHYLPFPHLQPNSMGQLSSAMLRTNSQLPSPAAVSQHTGSFHFSWTDAQRGRAEESSDGYIETRPVRTEVAPPSQQGTLYVGQSASVPLSFVCYLVGLSFTGQPRLHHPSQLGSPCRVDENYYCLSVTTPFPRRGPQEVRAGGEEALHVVGTTQSPVLLTKIYSTPRPRNWLGTSFASSPQPSLPE